jgi:hypothetical protein
MTFSWPSPRDSETEATARPPPDWQILLDQLSVRKSFAGRKLCRSSFLATKPMFVVLNFVSQLSVIDYQRLTVDRLPTYVELCLY